MLKHLYIKDFILIKELELDFVAGFSVFTGETGAGKSILIDAISYLCGNRADSSVIGKDSSKTVLEAVFEVKNNIVRKMLEEVDIDYEDELVITRIISRDNKSSVKINHRSTTLAFLKELMSNVVDLAAQHQSQYLLDKKNHLRLLDNFSANDTEFELLKAKVSNSYLEYHNISKELHKIETLNLSETELEFLNYQIDEITKFDFSLDEEDNLLEREKDISTFKKSYDSINESMNLLKYEGKVLDNLYNVSNLLETSDNTKIKDISSKFNGYYEEIIDLSEELSDFIDNFDFDERELDDISSRLYDINKLKRKYQVPTLKSLLDKLNDFQETISSIDSQSFKIAALQKKMNLSYKICLENATKLSDYRKKQAKLLEKSIVEELFDLKLKSVEFKVNFEESKLDKNGIDNVEFLISTNKNTDLNPLIKVASGGELSRLMLGLKVIFTKLSRIETIIFDEVDTGVSGTVSTSIGLKMAKLARDTQVFAVTHLATVASCATNHYYISKASNNDITESITKHLTNEERIVELAEITYGNVNDVSLQSAKRLLEENQRLVNDNYR